MNDNSAHGYTEGSEPEQSGNSGELKPYEVQQLMEDLQKENADLEEWSAVDRERISNLTSENKALKEENERLRGLIHDHNNTAQGKLNEQAKDFLDKIEAEKEQSEFYRKRYEYQLNQNINLREIHDRLRDNLDPSGK